MDFSIDNLAAMSYAPSNDYTRNPRNVVFRLIPLKKGISLKDSISDKNLLVYVSKGRILISYDGGTPCYVVENNYFFLSPGHLFCGEVEEDSEIFTESTPSNYLFSTTLNGIKKSVLDKLNERSYVFSPHEADESLRAFIKCAIDLHRQGSNDERFHDFVKTGVCFIVRNMYTDEQIAEFFKPILTQDSGFRTSVLNYMEIGMNISQIIANSGLCKTSFYSKFKNEFNMSINQWMQKEKAVRMNRLMADADLSLKDIMYKMSFASQSEFNRFCRRMYKLSPTELRGKILAGAKIDKLNEYNSDIG